MQRAVFYIGLGILVAIVVYSFTLVGSPSYNRSVKEDRLKVDVMQCMACSAQRQFCENGNLPADKAAIIQELEDSSRRYCSQYRCRFPSGEFDDVDFAPYEYELRDKEGYALCTEFANDSGAQTINTRDYNRPGSEFLKYPAGKHCFVLTAKAVKDKSKCR